MPARRLHAHCFQADGAAAPRVLGIDAEWTCAPAPRQMKLQWVQLASETRAAAVEPPPSDPARSRVETP